MNTSANEFIFSLFFFSTSCIELQLSASFFASILGRLASEYHIRIYVYDDAVASSIYDTSIVWRLSVTGRNAHTTHTNKQTYIGEAEEAKEEKK